MQFGAAARFWRWALFAFADVKLALTLVPQTGRMRWVVLIFLLSILSACDSPGWDYRGIPGESVHIDGLTYRVYARPSGAHRLNAQVIRMENVRRADHGPIRANMVRAAESATGCRAEPGAQGDTGVLNLSLRCPRR